MNEDVMINKLIAITHQLPTGVPIVFFISKASSESQVMPDCSFSVFGSSNIDYIVVPHYYK